MTRPRILLITPLLPWPARANGGAQRTALLLHALRGLGEVELLVIAPPELLSREGDDRRRDEFAVAAQFEAPAPGPAGAWRHLARLGPGPVARLGSYLALAEGRYRPEPEAAGWLGRRLDEGRYDLIACRFLRTAMHAGVGPDCGVPIVLDVDDVDWHVAASQAAALSWGSWKGKVAARLAQVEDRRAARARLARFDRVWVCSAEDAAEVGVPGAVVLPNVPYRDPGDPPPPPCPPLDESREVLCVASLAYVRNSDGVDHFLRHCWPRVRAEVPGATLRLVGEPPPGPIRERWEAADGVEVAGFVDDLRGAYARCALTLAPTRWGAGTKIKVVESLALGRTCLATPHALHGYGEHLRHGESLWRGPTDEAMAEGCIRLLNDPGLRHRLADRGREVVAERFSVELFRAVVRETCEPLLAGRGAVAMPGAPPPGLGLAGAGRSGGPG